MTDFPMSDFPMSARSRSLSRSRGISLLEVTIALLLLAGLMVLLSLTLASSSKLQSVSREHDAAREAIRAKLAEITTWPDFDTLSAFDGEDFAAGTGASSLAAQSGDQDGLPGEVTIDTSNPNLLRITIRVVWRGAAGNDAVEIVTMLTNPTPEPIQQ